MLGGYLKIALRNLGKNLVPSMVNITGLSVATACAIVVFLFLERQYTMDRFHERGDRIFRVENRIDRGNQEELWGVAPMPIGDAIERDIAAVDRVVRVEGGSVVFQVGELVFEEWTWFTDPEFLSMFSFPLATGSEAALSDPSGICVYWPDARLATSPSQAVTPKW